MKRHSLRIRKTKKLSMARKTSFNKHTVNAFYENLKIVHHKYGPIPPHRIYNLDETACTTVQNTQPVVVPKGFRDLASATSTERGTLVTMTACISAVGNHLPPMLIFPRVNFKPYMTTGAPPGTLGVAQPTGWSTDEMFLKFLDHFIVHVKPTKEERVLIVMDNHETHISVKALKKAVDNGIIFLTFPPTLPTNFNH